MSATAAAESPSPSTARRDRVVDRVRADLPDDPSSRRRADTRRVLPAVEDDEQLVAFALGPGARPRDELFADRFGQSERRTFSASTTTSATRR